MCFDIDPLPFRNRNRNGSQRYRGLLSWSCFSKGFLRSYVLFFRGQHRFSHVFLNAIHDSNPRNGMVLKQRRYLNFDTILIIMKANFYVQDLADPRILENPSCHTGLPLVSRHCVLSAHVLHLLFREYEVLSLFDKLQTRIRALFGKLLVF